MTDRLPDRSPVGAWGRECLKAGAPVALLEFVGSQAGVAYA